MRNLLLLSVFLPLTLLAQTATPPKVLVVTAHPDDETTFSVTLYKIAHDLKGTIDLALLTDGQGGFNGSELGSEYYRLNLTDSATGRAHLPAIRKQELLNAGRITGIRNYLFFDQKDDHYSQDPKPYLSGQNWDAPFIEKKLDGILAKGAYDFVLTMLPDSGQHGHHKTATLMALRAVQRYNGAKKPVVLAGKELGAKQDFSFAGLKGYPETRILKGAPTFAVSRIARFGHQNLLSYMIVADWVTAEYKSQGDLQNNGIHTGDLETFWCFDLNGGAGLAKAKDLFRQLNSSGYSNSVRQK